MCPIIADHLQAPTIARQVISYLIDTFVRNRYTALCISDAHLGKVVEDALMESPLTENGGNWMKPNLHEIGSASLVADLLTTKHEPHTYRETDEFVRSSLRDELLQAKSPSHVAKIERIIRPAKITGANIPNCIVPIKPVWAQHLFDEGLAEQTLLGADAGLILGWENVYYRAANYREQLAPPCRVLWYVSQDPRYLRSGQVRACSTIIETQILSAREAFSRFRRLGVYERSEVIRVAGGDPGSKVMVLRFTDTEILKNPINYNTAIEIVRTTDGLGQIKFQGPQPISEEAFVKLYSHGT